MSFPAYPAYKDSGVEWLGEVPDDWQVLSLRRAVDAVKTGGTPSEEPPESDIYGGVSWFTPGDFNGDLVLGESTKFVSKNSVKTGDAKIFPGGAVLVVSIGATIGKVGYLSAPASANQQINAVIPSSKTDGYFLAYSLSVKSEEMLYLSNASTIGIINQEKTKELCLVLPPFYEQLMIASFLDHETARIDALIEEQQRLIELLKEKRQALISHAVTKGLDPTVPMKDSGVEWLGKVPAHWNVTRSKFVFRLVSGYAFKSEFFQKNGDGGKVLITPGSFDELGKLYFSEKSTVQYEGEWQSQFELKVGDLVMVLTDLSYKKLILGRAAFVERDDALLNQRIAKVIITPKVKDNYLWFVINSEVMREQLKLTASGATVFHTSPEKVGDCWMALPPEKEQLEITAFVEEFHFKLDKLIQQVIDTVNLLSERRTALISAAVTGKIDVRGWQPPASAPSHELEQEAM